MTPPEIWREIGHRCERAELENLSLVSRSFCHIFQGLLFSTLSHNDPFPQVAGVIDDSNSVLHQMRGNAARIHAIANSHLALEVREWQFMSNSGDVESLPSELEGRETLVQSFKQLTRCFKENLYHFSNLQSLDLTTVDLDSEYSWILSRLPSLTTLHLEDVDIADTFSNNLMLEELCIVHTDSLPLPPFIEITAPQKLRKLQIKSFTNFRSYMVPLISRGSFDSLIDVELEVPRGASKIFYTFLNNAPLLEILEIHPKSKIDIDASLLAPSAIPRLQSYTGPINLSELLIPGRPVRSVHLTPPRVFSDSRDLLDIQHLMGKISLSTGPLRCLEITDLSPAVCLFTLPMIDQKRLPHLKKLIITVSTSQSDVDDMDVDDMEDYNEDDEELEEQNKAMYCDVADIIPGVSILTRVERANMIPQPKIANILVDGNGFPQAPDTFNTLMHWVSVARVPIHGGLRMLAIKQRRCKGARYTLAEQRRAVIGLSSPALPHLRSAMLGRDENYWVREPIVVDGQCKMVWIEPGLINDQ